MTFLNFYHYLYNTLYHHLNNPWANLVIFDTAPFNCLVVHLSKAVWSLAVWIVWVWLVVVLPRAVVLNPPVLPLVLPCVLKLLANWDAVCKFLPKYIGWTFVTLVAWPTLPLEAAVVVTLPFASVVAVDPSLYVVVVDPSAFVVVVDPSALLVVLLVLLPELDVDVLEFSGSFLSGLSGEYVNSKSLLIIPPSSQLTETPLTNRYSGNFPSDFLIASLNVNGFSNVTISPTSIPPSCYIINLIVFP